MCSLFFCYDSPVVDVFADGVPAEYLSECFAVQAPPVFTRDVFESFARLARTATLPRLQTG